MKIIKVKLTANVIYIGSAMANHGDELDAVECGGGFVVFKNNNYCWINRDQCSFLDNKASLSCSSLIDSIGAKPMEINIKF